MPNKVKIDRELFLSKLNKAIKFVPNKQIIPQFENFMLTISENYMEIVATDSNCEVKLSCPVESKEHFAICVPAKLFISTIALYRENEVVITQKSENKIEMKCGKSKCNITLDCFPSAFTTMPFGEAKWEITMHQFSLRLGLKSVDKFVDEKSPNANMAAINIAEINNKIVFTGLTQVLFCRAAFSPISINSWEAVSVAPEITNKVVALLGEKGEVGIIHHGDKIRFFTERSSNDFFEVTAVTAKAKFPNAEKFFSNKPSDTLVVDTQELLGAVKRLKLYTETGSEPTVHVSNALDPQNLRLVSSDNLTGKDGEEIISIINPRQMIIDKTLANEALIQVLSSIDQGEVNWLFNPGLNDPSFIIPKVNNEEENIYTFLISSIRA